MIKEFELVVNNHDSAALDPERIGVSQVRVSKPDRNPCANRSSNYHDSLLQRQVDQVRAIDRNQNPPGVHPGYFPRGTVGFWQFALSLERGRQFSISPRIDARLT
jgi:hypothetical protein